MSSNTFKEKRVTLIVIGVLAFTLCIALASFAMREAPVQESAERQAKEAAEKEKKKDFQDSFERENREIREALEKETDPEVRAKLEKRLKEREIGYALGAREGERMKEFRGAGLAAAKWAKISMEQAIQIATSQSPGAAIQCELFGEREDKVIYRVLILSGEENNSALTYVFVNAVDGTVVKTEKELPRIKSKP